MDAASSALLTDEYELTMISAALKDGTAARQCVFEVFARRLPPGRRYGVVAGVGRLVDAIADFRFTPDELEFLTSRQIVDADTANWLAGYRFSGDIDGYTEGELYFPGSPILTVSGSFAECVALETLVLSVLNYDSAIASAAARMVTAARGRPLIEMGSRRAHEYAAIAAARASYLAGFAYTSNLAAGRRYGVPTTGTAAHAFTLLHDSESTAFTSQIAALGKGTTLLVDTYDIAEGIRAAIAVAGTDLGAIRIDSGDLSVLAGHSRAVTGLTRRGGHPDRGLRRPGRVFHRRPGRRAGGRLWRRHLGGGRIGRTHRRADLQAGGGGWTAGGQAVREQSHQGRAKDRVTPAQANRHRH